MKLLAFASTVTAAATGFRASTGTLIFNGTTYETHDLQNGLDAARAFGGEGIYWAVSNKRVDKRQTVNCQGFESSRLVGDGNPHQNFQITQKTEPFGCPGTSGSQGYSDTVGWSVNGGANIPFISGGFAVSESHSQTTTFGSSCKGGNGFVLVNGCLQSAMALTAYTVNHCIHYSGKGCEDLEDSCAVKIIYAPNSDGKGSHFFTSYTVDHYNLIGCQQNGHVDLYYSGPRGSSSWWDGKPYILVSDVYMQAAEPYGVHVPMSVGAAWAAAEHP
ncbi:hypothetical protein VHEMI09813 [[Torrubiella] hemipterigena]|uniref:Uncharacterized protein n=1 Tax=[Torrubiella] hemipterigena TaxID=1531966 RepID=A0A0A1TS79_9HYPO|nr:hypothetical protein VHEMI09813 [[Torrubiella] hemipterigena]